MRNVAQILFWGLVLSVVAGCAGLGFLALASNVLGMDWPAGLLKLPWPLG